VSLALKAGVAWVVLFVIMFANGAFRVSVLQPHLGEHRARQVASLLGVVLVLLASWVFVRACPTATLQQLLWVGAAWVAGTLLFEFGFGHFASGLSWRALLADYNILKGRLWLLIIVSVWIGPWTCGVLAGRVR